MLENRSFDHMWGQSGIPGLTVPAPGTSNSYNGTSYPVSSPAPTAMTGAVAYPLEKRPTAQAPAAVEATFKAAYDASRGALRSGH